MFRQLMTITWNGDSLMVVSASTQRIVARYAQEISILLYVTDIISFLVISSISTLANYLMLGSPTLEPSLPAA